MSKLTRAQRRRMAREYLEAANGNDAAEAVAELEPAMSADPVLRAVAPVLANQVRRESEMQRESKQPRLSSPNKTFASVYHWLASAEMEEPAYVADSRKRDKWLRVFANREPLLAGVVNSVVTIDKNRGWNITGARRQVNAYMSVLHDNYVTYQDTYGWRPGIAAAARSYYTTDMGAVREIARQGKGGPLRGLYHVDSARCKLSGDPDYPLQYYAALGDVQEWEPDDYYRVCSAQSTDEALNGLGMCAVSRCISLAQIMLAVWIHDQEQLAARAPRGLLMLQNVTEDQWDTAMQARDEKLDSAEYRYYGAIAVLAGMGPDEVDAKLIALSNLPKDWNTERFVNMLMYGYALAFGYDPREFWPVSGGQLGTATETETQHTKATGKGGLDFALADQEALQRLLPASVLFEYEQRDVNGELSEVSVKQAQSAWVSGMYTSGLMQSAPLIDRDEARQLLAELGLIPEEWTVAEEEVTGTDKETQADEDEGANAVEDDANDADMGDVVEETQSPEEDSDQVAQRMLSREQVQRAIQRYPDEDIVTVHWPSMKSRVIRRATWSHKRKVF